MQKDETNAEIDGINILVAGYGAFGTKLVHWLEEQKQKSIKEKDADGNDVTGTGITIVGVIEPSDNKKDRLEEKGIEAYDSIKDIPLEVLADTAAVIDCSPKGRGMKNRTLYQELGLAAIFQNGEDYTIAPPYFPERFQLSRQQHSQQQPSQSHIPSYLRIPTCSGLSLMRVLSALQNSQQMPPVLAARSYHFKVFNEEEMFAVDYSTPKQEISDLFGLPIHVTRVYLRGQPAEKYVYIANLEVTLDDCIPKEDAIAVLSAGREVRLVSADYMNHGTMSADVPVDVSVDAMHAGHLQRDHPQRVQRYQGEQRKEHWVHDAFSYGQFTQTSQLSSPEPLQERALPREKTAAYVIRESVQTEGNKLMLMVLCYAPEIAFPETLAAAKMYAAQAQMRATR